MHYSYIKMFLSSFSVVVDLYPSYFEMLNLYSLTVFKTDLCQEQLWAWLMSASSTSQSTEQFIPHQHTLTWWRCGQDESCFPPTVLNCQAVLNVINVKISLWCVGSMAPWADSFISLFSTLLITVDWSTRPTVQSEAVSTHLAPECHNW